MSLIISAVLLLLFLMRRRRSIQNNWSWCVSDWLTLYSLTLVKYSAPDLLFSFSFAPSLLLFLFGLNIHNESSWNKNKKMTMWCEVQGWTQTEVIIRKRGRGRERVKFRDLLIVCKYIYLLCRLLSFVQVVLMSRIRFTCSLLMFFTNVWREKDDQHFKCWFSEENTWLWFGFSSPHDDDAEILFG